MFYRPELRGSILYVIPHSEFMRQCGGIGGHVSHVLGFVAAAARSGIRVHVIGPTEFKGLLASLPVETFLVPRPKLGGRIAWSWHLLRIVAQRVATESYDFCYIRYSAGFVPYLSLLKRILGGTRLVLEVNGLGSQSLRAFRFVDRWVLRKVDRVVVVSNVMKEFVQQVEPRLSSRQLLVLPNGVDIDKFRLPDSAESNEKPSGVRIGYVGVLKENYGLEDLVTAFRSVREKYPEASLQIVGDGPFRSQLKSLCAGLEGIELVGPVPFNEIPAVLHGFDIVVYTTSRRNSFQSPIKLFEYMAAGRAIVAARTPQVEETIAPRNCGLLYECGNAADLSVKLAKLIADSELRQRLRAAAAAEAVARHSWESRVRTLWDWL